MPAQLGRDRRGLRVDAEQRVGEPPREAFAGRRVCDRERRRVELAAKLAVGIEDPPAPDEPIVDDLAARRGQRAAGREQHARQRAAGLGATCVEHQRTAGPALDHGDERVGVVRVHGLVVERAVGQPRRAIDLAAARIFSIARGERAVVEEVVALLAAVVARDPLLEHGVGRVVLDPRRVALAVA